MSEKATKKAGTKTTKMRKKSYQNVLKKKVTCGNKLYMSGPWCDSLFPLWPSGKMSLRSVAATL